MKRIILISILQLTFTAAFCQHNFLIDKKSGIKYIISKDRKMLSALDKNGKTLWKINPYVRWATSLRDTTSLGDTTFLPLVSEIKIFQIQIIKGELIAVYGDSMEIMLNPRTGAYEDSLKD